jgi:hypothetical protein
MREVLVAELDSPEGVVAAARRVRALGYSRVEAYTPFPIPELDDALAIRRTRIPILVLLAGFTGAGLALLIQWWTNAFDYPLEVGARPPFSLPADVPIVFETTVLLASITAFAAVLLAARLPRLHDPLFDLPGFERTRIDRFWIVIADAFFMTSDIAEAEDEHRAEVLRTIQKDELRKLVGSLEELGAVVTHSAIGGAQ